jgi:hypothetical protein
MWFERRVLMLMLMPPNTERRGQIQESVSYHGMTLLERKKTHRHAQEDPGKGIS